MEGHGPCTIYVAHSPVVINSQTWEPFPFFLCRKRWVRCQLEVTSKSGCLQSCQLYVK